MASNWPYVLRRFRAAVVDSPGGQPMLAWIGDLYRIEGNANTNEERRRLRKSESREGLQKMRTLGCSPPASRSPPALGGGDPLHAAHLEQTDRLRRRAGGLARQQRGLRG